MLKKKVTWDTCIPHVSFKKTITTQWWTYWDFPGGSDGKSVCLQNGSPRFDPWVRKIHWRRKWQPTPVFLPGKFHGWRSLVGYHPWGRKELDTTERLHFHTSHVACFEELLIKKYQGLPNSLSSCFHMSSPHRPKLSLLLLFWLFKVFPFNCFSACPPRLK